MAALGVVNDQPVNSAQPQPLTNGIHLRLAFDRAHGFPWFGYYLFRREYRKTRPQCLASRFPVEWKGTWPAPQVALPDGVFSSDTALVFLNDRSVTTSPQFDLRARGFLRFALPDGQNAREFHVYLRMLGEPGSSSTTGTKTCADLTQVIPDLYPNPYTSNQIVFTAFQENKQLASSCDFVPVQSGGALRNHGEIDVKLPVAASSIEIDLVQAVASTQFIALDAAGNIVDQKNAGPAPNKQTIQLSSNTNSIVSAKIVADGIRSFILRFCYTEKTAGASSVGPIKLTAFEGQVPVATTTVSAAVGSVTTAVLASEVMTALQIEGGPAALVDICTVPVATDLAVGWKPLVSTPISLPVEHPDYPCPGKPTTFAQAQSLAQSRVQYPPPANWTAQSFVDLNSILKDLVVNGPAGGAMADRTNSYNPDPSDTNAPRMPDVRPLDIALIASLHPAIAMMLGLYWIDTTAHSGIAYDYMVVADHGGHFSGNASAVLSALGASTPLPADVDVCMTFGKKLEPAPPLAPPDSPSVYALPGAVTGNAPTGAGRNMAGLRWQVHTAPDGTLLANEPIAYNLWRADLNANKPSSPPATSAFKLLTADRLIIASETPDPTGATRDGASDWPPFPLIGFDPGLPDGWYSYCLSAVDLWGRHSALGPSGQWLQWSPAPTPIPWYYQPGAANDQVHPFAICLLDKTPPPRVPGVEADALDPDDPLLLRDAAFNTWWNNIEASWWNQPTTNRDQVLPLRVRWKWSFAQMLQAPDTKEFRIYFNPGTNPPAPDYAIPSNWQDRIYIVDYNDHVTQTTDDDGLPLRLYEVLLPVPGDDTSFPGVPLAPSETEPIVYAHIGVTAADDKQHTADDPTRSGTTWGDRPGNEGRIGAPPKIYRVLRSKPPAPAAVDDSEKILATRANYHGHSYCTIRWPKNGTLKAHLFRALDDTLFQIDWKRRASDSTQINPADATSFPIPSWGQSTRDSIAAELNALISLGSSGSFDDTVRAAYQALSDNALRTLAGLPGNEKAFTQMTYIPLDPDDPVNGDRPGPDGSDIYVPNPSLCAYAAELDGRAQNRYFYRAAYVNAAHTIGPLGPSSPPVYLPKVTPPRTPVITNILGAERQIELQWVRSREVSLSLYRVYRTSESPKARDIRKMERLAELSAADFTPSDTEVNWIDAAALVGTNYYYRVTALDSQNNESVPSAIVACRAVDTIPLGVPEWLSAEWVIYDADTLTMQTWPRSNTVVLPFKPAIRLEIHTPADLCTVFRRLDGDHSWTIISSSNTPAANEVVLFDLNVLTTARANYRAIASNRLGANSPYSIVKTIEPKSLS